MIDGRTLLEGRADEDDEGDAERVYRGDRLFEGFIRPGAERPCPFAEDDDIRVEGGEGLVVDRCPGLHEHREIGKLRYEVADRVHAIFVLVSRPTHLLEGVCVILNPCAAETDNPVLHAPPVEETFDKPIVDGDDPLDGCRQFNRPTTHVRHRPDLARIHRIPIGCRPCTPTGEGQGEETGDEQGKPYRLCTTNHIG